VRSRAKRMLRKFLSWLPGGHRVLRVEAIVDSRGRAIATSASNVARIGWNPPALLAVATAARTVGLPRKGVIVSSLMTAA
jgi:hypothetical protein